MLPKLLIVAVSILLTACGEDNKTDLLNTRQSKKALLDRILKGEPVKLSDLPKIGISGNCSPSFLAIELGYSGEDFEKLEGVVIRLPEPKPEETLIPRRTRYPEEETLKQ